MDRIQIGHRPDFCMSRGGVLINYHVKISGIHNQTDFKTRIIVDRSLAMVLKKIKQNLPVDVKDLILVEEASFIQNPRFFLKFRKEESHFEIRFCLPADLQTEQHDNIIDSFRKVFE